MIDPVLQVLDLHKQYRVGSLGNRKTIDAVAGVSLDLRPGVTTALVGESGSGKSTLARCILGLTTPTSGEILLDDVRMTGLSRTAQRDVYRRVQMVFQDPHASLNPRRTVLSAVEEPMYYHLGFTARQRLSRAKELLDVVQLEQQHLTRYPHELSGGQRQRVGIARALAADPRVLVLDEPTSSLDVSVRARVIELLQHIQRQLGLAYLFISHDLAVVRTMSTDVHVMLHGRIVEHGTAAELFAHPQHDYTRRLLDAIPHPEWTGKRRRHVPQVSTS